MGNNIKHIFSKIVSHKRFLLGVLLFALLFSIAPMHLVQANVFTDISTYILTLPLRIIAALAAVLIFLVALAAGFIFFLIGGFLGSFIDQTLAIKLLPGLDIAQGGIGVVNMGWEFSRGFVNILFILILVFIGLATILRIQNYQLQKTLPALLITALLVNFSGVFVAFIVDIANLFTQVFTQQFADFSLANMKSFAWDMPFQYFQSTLLGLFTTLGDVPTTLGIIIGSLVYGLSLLAFFTLAAIALFVVFLLFLVRVIILWILTILSPIAFAARILPRTQQYWDQWLKQLIQWSIIGIPLGLFLVLSKFVFENGIEFTGPSITDPGLSTWGDAGMGLSTFISNIFGPLVGIALIFVGITLSMQLAPAGAQGIINMAKQAGTRTAGWAARESWRKIGKRTEKEAGGVRKKGQDIAANAEARLKTENLGLSQKIGLNISRWGGKALSMAGSGIETASQRGNLVISKRDKDAIAKAEKGDTQELFERIDTERAAAAAKGGLLEDTSKELGAFTGIIKNGDTDDIYDRIKDGRMSWDFVRKMYKNAKDNGNKDQRRLIEKAFLSRTFDQKDAQGNIIPNELGVSAEDREKIFEKIDGADFKGVIGKESLDVTTESGKMAMDEIIKHRGADLIPQFLRNANKEQRQAASQYLNSKGVQWYIDNGAEDVLRYSLSSGAASLGINPIGGITQEELNQLIKPRASTESLNQEIGSIDAQLPNLDPTEDKDAIGNLKKRRKHLQEQIDARKAFAPEGAKSDDQRIKDQRADYTYYEQELKDLETKPESEKDADYYKERAELVKKRDELAGEFKRRGLGIRETTTIPLEDQPLSVQIARLKEQEEQLKQIAGTPRTIRGVEIPMTRKGGISYLPGEKARAERKKIQAKIKELKKQYAGLTPEVKAKEGEAGIIEAKMIEMEKSIQDAEREISTQQTLGATEQQLQQLRSLKQTQENELNRLKAEKVNIAHSWNAKRVAANGSLPEARVLAKDIAETRKEEQARTKIVAQLRTAKAAPKDIAAAQDVLQHVKNARQMAERKLVAHLETRSLEDASTHFNDEAQDIQDQRSQIVRDLTDIQTNIKNQEDWIDTGWETINAARKRLSQIQKLATEDLLRDNPELGMGSRQFKQEVEQRTSNDSVIQDYQRRLNTTKQALSQAKKELDGLNSLPESTKTTLLPQALENVQVTQHQFETIQQEMETAEANTRSRIIRELGTEGLGLQLGQRSSTLQEAVKNRIAQLPDWTTLNQRIKEEREAIKQAQTNLRINKKKVPSLTKERDELQDRVDKLQAEKNRLDMERQSIQKGEDLMGRMKTDPSNLSGQEKQQIEQYLQSIEKLQDKNKKQVEDILKETKAP